MLLTGAAGVRAAEAYAYFNSSNGRLYFCYDNSKSNRSKNGYSVYSLNTGSNIPAWDGISSSVKEIYFYSDFVNYKPTTCYRWFYGMTNLTTITNISNLNTSNVTNMGFMFHICDKLTSLDVSGFNTSNVTNMQSMFRGCSGLTSLNVSNFNTSKVTNMANMFHACSGLTTLNVANWNTSQVTSMRYLFYNCTSLTSVDIYKWKATLVSTMDYMFGNCYKLETIGGLTSLVLGTQYFVPSNVSTVEGMFKNCYKLYQLWLDNFLFKSSTTTTDMLLNCTGLKHLSLSNAIANYLNASACSGVGTTSSPCSLMYSTSVHPSFTTITPDYVVWKSGYFKSNSIKPYVVYYNNALTFYYDDYSSSRSGSVYNLNTGTNRPGWYSNNPYVKSVTVNSNFANARPTSCYEWFSGCSNLTSVSGFTYFNTSKVTTMAYMFKGCSSLSSLDLYWSNYITSNVTSMGYMFYGCSNLTSLLISGFNTSNVTDFGFMFYGCSKLSSINVSNFNTAKATYMVSMFQGCSNLTSISVSNFNTANAKSWMDQMFYGCSKLTSLDISSFTLSSSSAMMKGCSSLTYLKVPSTGSNLNTNACEGVGTTSKPCTLDPTGFTPSKEATGDGWFKWKTGYFLDNKAYANLSSDKTTLTFFYDKSWQTRSGNNYSLNTGSNAPAWHSYASSVTTVVFNSTFASARPTSCYEWFDGMTNLISITNMSSYLNTSQVTNMAYMFYNCKKLASVALSGFNTASVTSMRSMFYSCNNLTSIDVSKFNTAKVTDMEYMFYGCSKLPSLNIGNFNLSSLTASTQMMRDCSGLKTLTIPSTANKLDNTACVSVGTKFAPCLLDFPSGFTPEKQDQAYDNAASQWYQWKSGFFLDVWSYAELTNSGKTLTFYHDKKWNNRTGTIYSINVVANSWNYSEAPIWNNPTISQNITSVVFDSSFANARPTSCMCWFEGMSKLTSISGMASYLNTSKSISMYRMFKGCSKLTSIDVKNFNTKFAEFFDEMFYGCSSLTSLDLSSFNFVYNHDEDMGYYYNSDNMLKDCVALKTLTVNKTAGEMAPNACSGVGTKTSPCELNYPSGFTPEKTATGSGWYQWKSGYFKEDAPAESYAWLSSDGKKLTFCHDTQKASRTGSTYALNTGSNNPGWYDKRTSITSVEFYSAFADAEPTSCYRWFYGMSNLASITGLKYLETGFVTNMASMFNGCTKLTSLDLSKFNTTSVTSMSYMFYKCSKLTSLDLGNFETSSVRTMKDMFANCTALKSVQLYSGSEVAPSFGGPMIPEYETTFTTESITDLTSMFENCSSLKTFEFPGLTLKSSTTTANMCKGCTAMDLVYVTTGTLNYLDATAFDGVGATTECHLEMPDEFTPDITSRTFPYDATNGVGYVMWKSGKFVDFLDAYAVYMGGELTFYFDRELSRWHAAGVTDDGPFPYKVNITNESPGWLDDASRVTKVEFDKSFKDYLPNTTYRWFYGMTKLTSITGMKANLNTSKATSLASMFNNCASLKSVDVSNLNTSKATSLNYMFYKCAKLSSLDISGFTLKSTQTTTAMMQNCTGLKTLKIPATAGYLNAEACTGVGTKSNPCELIYPSGFTPEKQATGSGWFQWKSGYFKDDTKYPLGDVNHDGSVSIVDASLVTEYVLGNTPVVFFIEKADVNNDGSVTVTDVSKIIEMVLNNSAASAPATAREAAFDRLWITANGNHCLLHLDTPEQYNAMHLTLRLPEGGAMGNVRMSSTRSAGHHAEMRPMGGGLYNIVLHASDNAVLRSNDTALLHFDLAGCQPRDVEVVAVQSCNNFFETVMSAGATTGIEVVETTDDTDGDAYNAAGVRVTKNTRGVVVKNGMKKIK